MTLGGPVGVGVVGAGVISDQYLANMVGFPDLNVACVADLDIARAEAQAKKYGVANFGPVEELLADPAVEVVVNLTVPAAHAEVTLAALGAGKHVWTEKPLALNREDGRRLLEEARRRGLRVASAPDTFLGAGMQTALRLVGQGAIGQPLTALALMQGPGPESWHPNPEFLFSPGGGPLFDIGPYYLTGLVLVLGPVSSVSAASSKSRQVRVIGSGPRAGTKFAVGAPTHYGALLRFRNGGSAQVVFSFDSYRARQGFLEVYGTEGTVALPDPNRFDGDSVVFDAGHRDGYSVSATGSTSTRGTGVVELARALRSSQPERASGQLAYHVLDIMASVAEAAESGGTVAVESSFEPVPALPAGWDPTQPTL